MEASEQIERFKEFIEINYESELHEAIRTGKGSLILSFKKLSRFDVDLAEQLLQEPEEILKSAELSLDHFDLPDKYRLNIRFFDLPDTQRIKIGDIRSNNLGHFLVIQGIVRQASDVRPQVTSARFECPSCGNTLTILQLESKFKEPMRCTCGRTGKFRLLSQEFVDAQRLVIEEAPESLEGGEQPKRLGIFLKDDLVEPKMEKKTTPGSKIDIIGIVKEIPILLKTGAQSIRYELSMETNYIVPVQEDYAEIQLTPADIKRIKEFSKDKEVFDKFSSSIAPSIYGHEKVKEALVLQMFGGVRKIRGDSTVTRGDLHILLVGDPGAGKSQILQFVSKVAPKARFVSGKGSTSAGLTASVVKDEFLRGYSLEAGAMVLANKGIACIDELDKMNAEDRSALHQALEQQTITISKANIQATLMAQTTLLAAANPKFGRFDPYKPIAGQIELPSTLINRFDLIFPIRDIPNKNKDEKIAQHVLELPLKPNLVETSVDKDFLRKYLAYAKQNVFPKMTESAISEIKNFYVGLRNSGGGGDDRIKPIPISARQLEALVRLSEASARVRLSDSVTKLDARKAINLLKHCLMQVGFDPETGQIDIDRISTGITASVRNKIMIIKEIIDDLSSDGLNAIPIEQIVNLATEKGIEESSVEEVIDKLKKNGDIFEPRRGFISRIQ